jgi:hypothetical protein
MGAEGSLPHLQQPATCSYSEPHGSSPCPTSRFSKIHFNIILSSSLCFHMASALQVTHQNPHTKRDLSCLQNNVDKTHIET